MCWSYRIAQSHIHWGPAVAPLQLATTQCLSFLWEIWDALVSAWQYILSFLCGVTSKAWSWSRMQEYKDGWAIHALMKCSTPWDTSIAVAFRKEVNKTRQPYQLAWGGINSISQSLATLSKLQDFSQKHCTLWFILFILLSHTCPRSTTRLAPTTMTSKSALGHCPNRNNPGAPQQHWRVGGTRPSLRCGLLFPESGWSGSATSDGTRHLYDDRSSAARAWRRQPLQVLCYRLQPAFGSWEVWHCPCDVASQLRPYCQGSIQNMAEHDVQPEAWGMMHWNYA